MTISHLVALNHSTGYSPLCVSSKVRRASSVIYSIPVLELGREKNATIERGSSVKEHWFTSWIGANYPPFPPPSSGNILIIQYLAAVMLFFPCSFWFSVKFRRLWFGKRYEGVFPMRDWAPYQPKKWSFSVNSETSVGQRKGLLLEQTLELLQFIPAGMKKNRPALSVGFECFMESCQRLLTCVLLFYQTGETSGRIYQHSHKPFITQLL